MDMALKVIIYTCMQICKGGHARISIFQIWCLFASTSGGQSSSTKCWVSLILTWSAILRNLIALQGVAQPRKDNSSLQEDKPHMQENLAPRSGLSDLLR